MGKALVIVESPAKAKTINKYLGNDYVVKSSVGHIRDLPTSGSASKKIQRRSYPRFADQWISFQKRAPTLPPPKGLKKPKKGRT